MVRFGKSRLSELNLLLCESLTKEMEKKMNMNEFINGMNELRREYGFCIDEDCDLWSCVTGFIFYRDMEAKKGFAHITGIQYTSSGDGLEGDFKGVLELMTEAVKKEYT